MIYHIFIFVVNITPMLLAHGNKFKSVNSNPSVKPAKLINYGEIDLGANGCYFLNESFPEIRGAKHIEIAYWTSIIPMSPLSVYAGVDGRCYVFGSPNTKVHGLKIYYWK